MIDPRQRLSGLLALLRNRVANRNCMPVPRMRLQRLVYWVALAATVRGASERDQRALIDEVSKQLQAHDAGHIVCSSKVRAWYLRPDIGRPDPLRTKIRRASVCFPDLVSSGARAPISQPASGSESDPGLRQGQEVTP